MTNDEIVLKIQKDKQMKMPDVDEDTENLFENLLLHIVYKPWSGCRDVWEYQQDQAPRLSKRALQTRAYYLVGPAKNAFFDTQRWKIVCYFGNAERLNIAYSRKKSNLLLYAAVNGIKIKEEVKLLPMDEKIELGYDGTNI